MTGNETFEVLQGIWNPAEQNNSWMFVEDFESLKDARAFVRETIIETLSAEQIANNKKTEWEGLYTGPPLVVVKTIRKVLDRIGVENQPALADDPC